MAQVFGYPARDVRRINAAVKAYEQAPARRPVGESNAPVLANGTVCVVEIVSGPDVNGDYVVKLQERLPDGTWQQRSPITVTMEDLNA